MMAAAQPFITTAFKKDGKFHVRNKPQFEKWTKLQRDGEFTVTFERAYATRSLEQNSVYWAGYVKPLADEFGWTSNDMHEYLKAKFLPEHKRKVKTLTLINRRTGEIIDEHTVDLSTTRKLNKVEFSEYLRDIQVWATGHGVDVGTNREDAA